MNKFPDNIVEYSRNQRCEILYAQKRNGSMPAKEFLESLDKRDRTKLVRLFDRMRQKGEIKNPEKFKKLKGCNQLYEFKSKPFRILTFRKGYTWFLTNGFKKDDDETPREEIKRGVDIMQEHLSRS